MCSLLKMSRRMSYVCFSEIFAVILNICDLLQTNRTEKRPFILHQLHLQNEQRAYTPHLRSLSDGLPLYDVSSTLEPGRLHMTTDHRWARIEGCTAWTLQAVDISCTLQRLICPSSVCREYFQTF